jgi:hypothetical protein
LNILWAIGVLVVNDLIIMYTLYLFWKHHYERAFNLHIVNCDDCGAPQVVPLEVESFDTCPSCHVCEGCGKHLRCETCGKDHLVRQDIEGISFCNSIGCFEKFKLNNKKPVKKRVKVVK